MALTALHLNECPVVAELVESLGEELRELVQKKLSSQDARKTERPSVQHYWPRCLAVSGESGAVQLYIGHGRRVALGVCLRPSELSTLLGENWDLVTTNLHDAATCAWRGSSCKHHGGVMQVLGVSLKLTKSKLTLRFDVTHTMPNREIERYGWFALLGGRSFA